MDGGLLRRECQILRLLRAECQMRLLRDKCQLLRHFGEENNPIICANLSNARDIARIRRLESPPDTCK